MSPLEISTAAMSANSGSLIIVCAVASAVILVISFFRERLKAGIPYYGSYEDEDHDILVGNVMSIPTAIQAKEAKEVKEYGDSGSHAA